MNVEQLLRDCRLDFPTLARLSGLSEGYLRQLSSGNRNAGPQTKAKLAAALTEHARRLDALATRLTND